MQKPLQRSTRTARPAALCLTALILMLVPVVWAPAVQADDTMAPGSDRNVGDVMNTDENGSQQGDGRDDDGDGNTNEDDEQLGGNANDEESGGLVEGIADTVLTTVVTDIVEKISDAAAALVENFLTEAAFTLPDPTGDIRDFYDKVGTVVQPGAIVLLLLTGLMLMLRGANYNTAYATQSALPKIVFFFAALAFFPKVMKMISDLTQALAGALLDPAQISDAFQRLLGEAGGGLLFTAAATTATGGGAAGALAIVGGIVAVVGAVFCFLLVLLNVFKGFMFGALFIAGPLALFLYPIPALSGLATQWFKGMLACTAIPLLWSLEAAIGTAIIADPTMVFGEGAGMSLYGALVLLVLMWVMIKTPFKVLEWAFFGYSSGNGFAGHIAKSVVASTVTRGIGK